MQGLCSYFLPRSTTPALPKPPKEEATRMNFAQTIANIFKWDRRCLRCHHTTHLQLRSRPIQHFKNLALKWIIDGASRTALLTGIPKQWSPVTFRMNRRFASSSETGHCWEWCATGVWWRRGQELSLWFSKWRSRSSLRALRSQGSFPLP